MRPLVLLFASTIFLAVSLAACGRDVNSSGNNFGNAGGVTPGAAECGPSTEVLDIEIEEVQQQQMEKWRKDMLNESLRGIVIEDASEREAIIQDIDYRLERDVLPQWRQAVEDTRADCRAIIASGQLLAKAERARLVRTKIVERFRELMK